MNEANTFEGKYRTQSTRLRSWDYCNPGYYFVTICAQDRQEWFGKIAYDEMQLSETGKIIDEEWKKTAAIRPYVTLDSYIIMPNHFHGILILNEISPKIVETSQRDVSTFGPDKYLKSHSLGSIINQFKSICTKRIRRTGCTDFSWQPRFYDHIIRDENETIRIRKYLNSNPIRWDQKELFAEDLS